MKRMIVAALLLAALLTLAACGKKEAAGTLDTAQAQQDIAALGVYPESMLTLDAETLSAVYGIPADKLQDQLCVVPMMNVHASAYWLLLPESGEEGAVRAALDKYLEGYQASWDQYLPEQAELVRGRLETTLETADGTWLVCIISGDNDAVFSAVQGAVK